VVLGLGVFFLKTFAPPPPPHPHLPTKQVHALTTALACGDPRTSTWALNALGPASFEARPPLALHAAPALAAALAGAVTSGLAAGEGGGAGEGDGGRGDPPTPPTPHPGGRPPAPLHLPPQPPPWFARPAAGTHALTAPGDAGSAAADAAFARAVAAAVILRNAVLGDPRTAAALASQACVAGAWAACLEAAAWERSPGTAELADAALGAAAGAAPYTRAAAADGTTTGLSPPLYSRLVRALAGVASAAGPASTSAAAASAAAPPAYPSSASPSTPPIPLRLRIAAVRVLDSLAATAISCASGGGGSGGGVTAALLQAAVGGGGSGGGGGGEAACPAAAALALALTSPSDARAAVRADAAGASGLPELTARDAPRGAIAAAGAVLHAEAVEAGAKAVARLACLPGEVGPAAPRPPAALAAAASPRCVRALVAIATGRVPELPRAPGAAGTPGGALAEVARRAAEGAADAAAGALLRIGLAMPPATGAASLAPHLPALAARAAAAAAPTPSSHHAGGAGAAAAAAAGKVAGMLSMVVGLIGALGGVG